MANCTVTGKLLDATSAFIPSVTVTARLAAPVISGTSLVMPDVITATTSTIDGSFTLNLLQSISVLYQVQFPPTGTEPLRIVNYVGNIPATTTANFTDTLVIE